LRPISAKQWRPFVATPVEGAAKSEAELRPEWRASWHGISIYFDRNTPRGVLKVFDGQGVLMATMHNVGTIYIGGNP
jgi:hypothetical protein